MTAGHIILVTGALLLVGVAAASIGRRLEIPAFLLSLVVGMAIGSDGAGWVRFDDYVTAQHIGTACLAVILFEGGWRTNLAEMRSVWVSAVGLALPGTILTAATTAIAAAVLLQLPPFEAMLLGAILASTDGAAVFGLLRRSGLRRRLVLILEGETGLNDPVAILLVVSLVDTPGGDPATVAMLFTKGILLGLLIGIVVGLLGAALLRSGWLPSDALYAVASLGLAGLAFGVAETIGGSGFLAVYVAGLLLGHELRHARRFIGVFQQGVATFADIGLFITFGLVVHPGGLLPAAAEGAAVAIIVAFVARPVAVWLLTIRTGFTRGEKVLLSWAGLRGAVPMLLATIPITAHVPGGQAIFDVTFVAVLASDLMQGTTVGPLARMLRLTAAAEGSASDGADADVVEMEYRVPPVSEAAGMRAYDLQLPRAAVLTSVIRSGRTLVPTGTTRVRVHDTLRFLVASDVIDVLEAQIGKWDRPSSWAAQGRGVTSVTTPSGRDRGSTLLSGLRVFGAAEWVTWKRMLGVSGRKSPDRTRVTGF